MRMKHAIKINQWESRERGEKTRQGINDVDRKFEEN